MTAYPETTNYLNLLNKFASVVCWLIPMTILLLLKSPAALFPDTTLPVYKFYLAGLVMALLSHTTFIMIITTTANQILRITMAHANFGTKGQVVLNYALYLATFFLYCGNMGIVIALGAAMSVKVGLFYGLGISVMLQVMWGGVSVLVYVGVSRWIMNGNSSASSPSSTSYQKNNENVC
ncbi:hypothetical protein HDU76_003510 [Blyttiomyces sp. JEL0837]|nr:hypothetical protein HDU76_003510 [Blyttiomyces sp. JEL0837]